MSLIPGQNLLHYRLVEKIGAGGMGVVYRATDTKLRRDVAIKVLPEDFAEDEERLARFSREARVLASLNHPAIAAIHGFEETAGVRFLVLELVPGETLADRIKKVPFTVPEALDIAAQMAEALADAHEHGVIHRDLKPANVKLTPDGKVKLLDFGLAKAMTGDGPPADPSESPTVTLEGTWSGAVLGTAAYMSPEQARGHAVDKRTDIFAFGSVLYEMLTGRRAFEGETVSDTIAAVLEHEPNWLALDTVAPPGIASLLRRCLRKDPHERLHDMADARIEIVEALSSGPTAAARQRKRLSSRSLWTFALLVLVALGAYGIASRQRDTQSDETLYVSITLPPQLDLLGGATVAISPDGSRIVVSAREEDTIRLYVRSLASQDVVPLPGTENASSAFFSPDGLWVAFFSGGRLRKVSVGGGTPIDVCDIQVNRGGSWSDDGTIVFAPGFNTGLARVSDSGGEPSFITSPDVDKNERTHRWPHVLPGGKGILFTVGTLDNPGNYDDANIAVLDVSSGDVHEIISGGSMARYSPTGHILYARAATLLAVPFDLDQLQVTGPPARVFDGVAGIPSSGEARFDISQDGTLVYVPEQPPQSRTGNLTWVDRDGRATTIHQLPVALQSVQLSPNGNLAALALGVGPGEGDVWIYSFARSTLTRLTFHGMALGPIWTADGKRVVYGVTTGGSEGISWKLADGSADEELIVRESPRYPPVPEAWVPETQNIIYSRSGGSGGYDVMMADIQSGNVQPLLDGPHGDGATALSPDGNWMAYVSNESGRFEVYVRPFPGPGGKWQVSTEGGRGPRWSRQENELFYTDGEKMMVVPVEFAPNFSAGTPRKLFEFPFTRIVAPFPDYDVTSDGQRFIFSERPKNDPTGRQINVITHFRVTP